MKMDEETFEAIKQGMEDWFYFGLLVGVVNEMRKQSNLKEKDNGS